MPADRLDSRWQVRESLILSQLETEAQQSLYLMLHIETSLMSAQQLKNASKFSQLSQEYYKQLIKLLMPYATDTLGVGVKSLIDQWKAVFGDPDDPEVAERIKKTSEFLRKESNNG
jgi:hypothetical protein